MNVTTMTEQRSPQWFEARKNRVTGSVCGAILGLSPYMSRADAMRMMVRAAAGAEREFQGNVATEYGAHHEAGALVEFQMETGLSVAPAPFVPYEDWMGASPDGFVSDGGLIELKCPFALRKAAAPVAFKSIHDQPHYMAQIQVQLFVTGVGFCHFFQWATNGTSLERVEYDQAWGDENISKLKQFYAEFLHELEHNASEHIAPKRVEIDTPEAFKMVAEWDDLNEQLDRVAERKRDLLDEMVTIAGGKNAIFADRKLTLTERAGSIGYAKAVKALLPNADLEKWRGAPSQFWGLK